MTRQRRKHRRTAALQVLALTGGIIALAGAALMLGYQLGSCTEAAEPVAAGQTVLTELPGLPGARSSTARGRRRSPGTPSPRMRGTWWSGWWPRRAGTRRWKGRWPWPSAS